VAAAPAADGHRTLAIAAGVVVGVIVALFAGKAASAMLFGIAPQDPLTIVAAVSILVGAAVASGLIPAYRAATVDPMRALRDE
jgi:ABC-type antimicrobial peptide transport system permease subunit